MLNIDSSVFGHLVVDPVLLVSQTQFGHISINSSMILMVSKTMESPQKDLLINASHVSRQLILAKILSRLTSNHHITIY